MTDVDRFDARLQARLDAHLAPAVRQVDAMAIARAAMRAAPARRGWTDVVPRGIRGWAARRWPSGVRMASAVAVALLAGVLIGAGIVLVGTTRESPPPSSQPSNPATSPSATAAPASPTSAPVFVPPTPPAGPASGTFEATGSLNAARAGHTALLLRDGRVLVIGGWTAESVLSVAPPTEMYDPATGTFERFDPIVFALNRGNDAQETNQAEFTATELADGRVLVAGGRLGAGPLAPPPAASAVLFDPATGLTTPTGEMTVARAGHVAALLGDGRVLVAGGVGGTEESLASAEIYDPSTGRFTATGPLAHDRAYKMQGLQATVLPSGRVLVSGGLQVDPTGGTNVGDGVDELYDPTTGAFLQIPTEVAASDRTALLLLGDRIFQLDLSTGARTDLTPQPADLVERFGPYCRDLPGDCRQGMTTTLLADGRVLLAGGTTIVLDASSESGRRTIAQAWGEVLDTGSGAIGTTGPFVEPRIGHTATLLADGRVLLIGGYVPGTVQSPEFLASAELYTPID